VCFLFLSSRSARKQPEIMDGMDGMDSGSSSNVNGMDMGMGDMGMQMTFSKWNEYKVTIVFDWWKVETVTQYVFSWLFIVLLVVLLFVIKMPLLGGVEETLRLLKTNTKENGSDHEGTLTVNGPNGYAVVDTKDESRDGGPKPPPPVTATTALAAVTTKSKEVKVWVYRVLHAALAATGYGLALMLMLISMTYNVGLCVALLVGYFVGDLLCFHGIIKPAASHNGPSTGPQECCSL